jgi:lipopolysaccharide/colanic/teichoic acid biosynthesis glycosyltransferase
MTSSTVPALEKNYSDVSSQPIEQLSYCSLFWRQGKLLVKSPGQQQQPHLPCLEQPELLVECLKKSSVSLVLIDPNLGESKLNFWADACKKAHKHIYISIPSPDKHFQKNTDSWKWLKYSFEWLITLIFLVVISPVMLGIIFLMYFSLPGSLFTYEWHVGNRGRLFQLIKFRTTRENAREGYNDLDVSTLGSWMRKYGLDRLPQLFNVIRGDLNLSGRSSLNLKDLIWLNLEGQKQLHQVPGILALWQLKTRFKLLPHLNSPAL